MIDASVTASVILIQRRLRWPILWRRYCRETEAPLDTSAMDNRLYVKCPTDFVNVF